jgi:hypothetical protein
MSRSMDDAARLRGSRLRLSRAGFTVVGLRGGGELGHFSGYRGLSCGRFWRNPVAFGVQLVGVDVEAREMGGTEAGGEGDVGCVAACGHQDSSQPAVVVASVEVDPSAVEEDLVPGAEVSGAAVGLPDVTDVAGDVAGWNVLAACEGDGEMLEVAADADALGKDIHGGLGGASCVVVEGDSFMDPVSNGNRTLPALWVGLEEVSSDGAELVDLAVPAGQKELQYIGRKVVDGGLLSIGIDRIDVGAGVDDVGAGQPQISRRSDEACTSVAEAVDVVSRRYDRLRIAGGRRAVVEGVVEGLDQELSTGLQRRLDRGVQMEHRDDRSGCGKAKLNVKFRKNEQGKLLYRGDAARLFERIPSLAWLLAVMTS